MTLRIYLDDERDTPIGYTRCYWPAEVIKYLESTKVDEISLDHDLGDDDGHGTGYSVLVWIEEMIHTGKMNYLPVLKVHSANPSARIKMQNAINSINNYWDSIIN